MSEKALRAPHIAGEAIRTVVPPLRATTCKGNIFHREDPTSGSAPRAGVIDGKAMASARQAML